MSKLYKIGIVCMVFLINTIAAIAQSETLFEQATQLYNDNQFEQAIEKYNAILANGEHSDAVYYNLGNAHYKLNNVAKSIYFFEKAKQLVPNDADIQNNLAFAQNMTIDAIDAVPQPSISKFFKSMINKLSFDGWATLAVMTMLVFVGLFLWYHFSRITSQKRLLFLSSVVFLLLSIISLVFAFQQESYVENDRHAIVFTKQVTVQNEPNRASEDAFTLHEGTKVSILEDFGEWQKIQIIDGSEGWIEVSAIKEL